MLAVAICKRLDNLTGLTYSTTGGNLFPRHMPTSPNVAVMVKVTGGFPQMTKEPDDLPTVQILVRGAVDDRVGPDAMAHLIYSDLACLDGVTLDEGGDDEIYVVGCTPMQSAPIDLGQDVNGRFESSLNFAFHTHAPTLHRV